MLTRMSVSLPSYPVPTLVRTHFPFVTINYIIIVFRLQMYVCVWGGRHMFFVVMDASQSEASTGTPT